MIKDKSETESRRKILKTAGKFAVDTPPALMIMSSANVRGLTHSNNGCGNDSNDVTQPGGSPPNNDAQNAQGGQNCPETSQGQTF